MVEETIAVGTAAGATVGLGILAIFFILALVAVAILLFIFWIMMIVDCVKRNFKNSNDKIVWILVIIFLQIIGAAIYYFVVKIKDKKK